MNETGNDQYISAEAVPIALAALAQQIRRIRPTAPPAQRGLLIVLEQQCRQFDINPQAVRKMMIDTIEAIENAA